MKQLFLVFALLALVTGCTGSSSGNYTQVERLGRPAINEGLVTTNALLTAFNSVAPSADLTDAAKPVIDHVVGTLTLINTVGKAAGLAPPTVGDVAAGFVPDVMRIDTTVASGYAAKFEMVTDATGTSTPTATSGPVMLTGGRLITDDVMDITIQYLFGGLPSVTGDTAVLKDNVTYAGANAFQGHTTPQAAFPYLARPL